MLSDEGMVCPNFPPSLGHKKINILSYFTVIKRIICLIRNNLTLRKCLIYNIALPILYSRDIKVKAKNITPRLWFLKKKKVERKILFSNGKDNYFLQCLGRFVSLPTLNNKFILKLSAGMPKNLVQVLVISWNLRRNPVYCSLSTNIPPPPYFLFLFIFRAPHMG